MNNEKTHLLKQLDDARDYLWSVLDTVEPASKINSEWNKRDFFAHMAGWDALVYEIFRDYVAGVAGKPHPYTNVDETNRDFVNVRQRLTMEGAKLECDINRFAIKTLLQSIPAEDYDQSIQFPWGVNTVVEFVQGAIEHEREHAEDIVKALNDDVRTSLMASSNIMR